jgi:hypothetical protein
MKQLSELLEGSPHRQTHCSALERLCVWSSHVSPHGAQVPEERPLGPTFNGAIFSSTSVSDQPLTAPAGEVRSGLAGVASGLDLVHTSYRPRGW